jgi:hypothetical protein
VSVGGADVAEELGTINRYRICNKEKLNHVNMAKRYEKIPDSLTPDLFYNYEQKDRSCQICLVEGGEKVVIRCAGTEE